MSLSRLFAALTSLSLLAACAGPGGYRVNAQVRSMNAGSRSASGIVNSPGARLELSCPDAAQSRSLGTTDASGAMDAGGEGVVPLDCSVTVAQDGFKPAKFKVADVCQAQNTKGCREVEVRAILTAAK